MAKDPRRHKTRSLERDSGGFVALPWSVLDSASYARLSNAARALLLEVARQYVRDNNGRLLLSRAYLLKRSLRWNSADVITRAKRELLEGGFIHETVKGHRPNRASWYAVTWHPLDRILGYDPGAEESFERSAYKRRHIAQNATLKPPNGMEAPEIAPPDGAAQSVSSPVVPSHGAMRAVFDPFPVPPHGHHLDMPSPVAVTKH